LANLNSSAPSKPGVIYANDYALINLTLLSSVSTFDMKNILVELSYSEDLFGTVTTGYLMVIDSQGFIERLRLVGNEFLRLTFAKTRDDPNVIDKIFRVYKVAKRQAENEGNTETYSLYFCSEEMLLSEQYKVAKSYRAKDISSNVVDILKNYLKVDDKKIGVIEQTYGTYDFIVPYLKPFDAINWMSTYARPNANLPGADMIFYEDVKGFNYRSLQTLIKQTPYNSYSYNTKNVDKTIQTISQKAYNVSSYEILDSYDALGAIHSGMFANRLISIDILLRRYKVTDFDYGTYASKSTTLNPYPITNNFKNRKGDGLNQAPESVMKLVFSNYNQKDSAYVKENGGVAHDIFAETYIPYRTAQLPLLNYTRVKITVPGDSGLTVGRVIGFELMSNNPTSKATDAFYSGNYLITGVRHMITVHAYKTVLELAKESTKTQYPSVDNTSAIWTNTVKGLTS
jgi:hypothetical protein